MNTSIAVLIALAALFIGVLIPVLLQLRATLRALERRLETTGSRLDRILEDSEVVVHRLARVSSGLEGGEESVFNLMTSLGNVSKAVSRTSSWLAVASSLGAAVAPAVATAVRAYREREPEYKDEALDAERPRDGEVAPAQERARDKRAATSAPGGDQRRHEDDRAVQQAVARDQANKPRGQERSTA